MEDLLCIFAGIAVGYYCRRHQENPRMDKSDTRMNQFERELFAIIKILADIQKQQKYGK